MPQGVPTTMVCPHCQVVVKITSGQVVDHPHCTVQSRLVPPALGSADSVQITYRERCPFSGTWIDSYG
jgi:hypothetical protein